MRQVETKGLRETLAPVYWIGGGSGGGKSTVARRLAARHNLHVYDTDAAMSEHGKAMGNDAPFLRAFVAMDMDERWVRRSPSIMLETFHWFQGEGFDLIVKDLLERRPPGVVAEGFRLIPRLVRPLLSRRDRAIWLLPTPAFRRAAFEQRGTLWQIPNRTSDPDRALRNILARDKAFTEQLRFEADGLGLPVIEVGIGLTEDELVDRVERAFDLSAASTF